MPPQFAKLNTGKRLRIVRPAVACLGALLVMSSAAYSQVPEPRLVAAPGHPDSTQKSQPVWETWIAAGAGRIVSVFHAEYGSGTRIGYAILDPNTAESVEYGVIGSEQDDVVGVGDPSVAYVDAGTDDFLACAMVSQDNRRAIGVADFDSAEGTWESWRTITALGGYNQAFDFDKPWLVAGGVYESKREFYVTYWQKNTVQPYGPTRHRCARSTDGGVTWTISDISFGIGGDVVEIRAAGYQPTVVGDEPFYIAYTPYGSEREIRFLKGTDIDDPNDAHVGDVEFSAFPGCDSYEFPGDDPDPILFELIVTRNRSSTEIHDMLPGGADLMNFQSIPWLAADPNDPNQLYLVYHDTATNNAGDLDVNVYCQKLRYHLSGWCAASRVKVNDGDDQNYEVDQIMPSVWVDHAGRVHIIYYDDRRYNVDSDQDEDTEFPRVDVYYAYSEDGGSTWDNSELTKDPYGGDPNETCLDYNLLDRFDFPFKPGDYNGIAGYGDTVWTSFTGTSGDELEGDPESNPSVIWSCRIPF